MQEHCERHGHAEMFTTDNYGLTTTPELEFRIATGQTPCPEEAKKDQKGRTVRDVKPLAVLKTLPVAQTAKLTEMEIVSVVRAAPCPALARSTLAVLLSPPPCVTLALIAAFKRAFHAGPLQWAHVPGDLPHPNITVRPLRMLPKEAPSFRIYLK